MRSGLTRNDSAFEAWGGLTGRRYPIASARIGAVQVLSLRATLPFGWPPRKEAQPRRKSSWGFGRQTR